MTEPTKTQDDAPASGQDLKNLYEAISEAFGYLIQRDRDERRWLIAKRSVLGIVTLLAAGAYFALWGPMLGWSSDPSGDVVGVVPVQGEIGGSGSASADALVPAIERSCKSPRTKALVLRISSPGGSPTDAERIAGALEWCRPSAPGAKRKPVIAVIEGVGASAAYLIAIHADEIYSTRYALVGSIGAVMRSVDAGEALGKVGLKERVYASGSLKAGNSPWTSNTPAQDQLSQSLVDGIAELFIAEVKERRGSKLKPADDLFSGRVWVGPEALRLGLIDGNTTFEALHEARFRGLPVHLYRPTQTLQDKLGLSAVAREFGVGLTQGISDSRWQ